MTRLTDDARGRLTLPDVLFALGAVAFLGALWPVVAEGMEDSAGYMSAGELYLFRLVLPVAILVLFTTIYVSAAGGVGR